MQSAISRQAENGGVNMKKYTYLGCSAGKRFCIEGIDVFSSSWRNMGECDIVLHPETGRPYSFSVYSVQSGSKTVKFLAGKFDDDRWAFFKELTEEDIIF